jgi:carboxylesterase
MIIPTAEPFFFQGNKIGCLLIHGFTGAPKEMRWLGEYLANQGYTVLGVRLAGHATRPEDMRRMNWEDWAVSVEDGYYL